MAEEEAGEGMLGEVYTVREEEREIVYKVKVSKVWIIRAEV